MHICHFICSTGLGRGEFYVDLVNEMVKKENITLLIPINSKYKNRISSSINVIEYKSRDKRFNPFFYFELLKVFKSNNFDVVHTHFAKASSIFHKINKFLNLKHIATKHNVRKGKIFNSLKYVTAVSNDSAKSIDNENVKIIYNGINPIEVVQNYRNEKFTITAIGRLDKIKGFDKLINDMTLVKNDCILEIIGNGDEYKSLQKLINKLGLENKVKLLGFKDDIPQIIANSDLVIMTSLSEGFSLVMVESLFYGKVFISTKVSGCKDILTPFLLIEDFKIAEKINDVIDNYDKYLFEYKNLKSKYTKTFLLSNISDEYIEYYKEVICGI